VISSQHRTALAQVSRFLAAGAAAIIIAACQPAGAATSTPLPRDPLATAESLRVGQATLKGTLLRPAATARVPVAVIVAGSGPTDRDGNTPLLPGRNNSLRMLAEGLASRGIATLRYDKRGVGESTSGVEREDEVTFEMFVADVAAWGQRLQRDERFSEVVVVGHSEGGLLGLLAAPRVQASRVVTIAGLGRPAGVVLREQLGRQISGELLATADSILTVLEGGGRVREVPAALQVLFRPSVQPYLSGFLQADPAAAVARLEVPVLVIHGTTDEQIARADAEALAAASPRAVLRVFGGMNHVLKPAPPGLAQQLPAYTDSTIALAPGLVDTIATFIRRR
jgi:uncharacterized protein